MGFKFCIWGGDQRGERERERERERKSERARYAVNGRVWISVIAVVVSSYLLF